MTKLIALAVYDNCRQMIVSPVVNASKANEDGLLKDMLNWTEQSIRNRVRVREFHHVTVEQKRPHEPEEDPVFPHGTTGDLILRKITTVFSDLDDSTQGPYAYIWLYAVDDILISRSNCAMLDFDVDDYPNGGGLNFAEKKDMKQNIAALQADLIDHIASTYKDHQDLKYYEVCNPNNYTLLVYDPRIKDSVKSIKGRIYVTQFKC